MTTTVTPTREELGLPTFKAPHKVSPGEISIGVIIGRTSEFFDFFVYAIASVLVFPKLFFPFADPLQGTIYSFAVFALAFIARPIGTLIFMAVDRAYGRGVKLTIALFALGGSTAGIAFLPTYAQIGETAIWLLAAFRIAQGLALGGTWDGLPSLLSLHAPENRRGWYAMIPQLGAPFGLIVASLLFAYMIDLLPAEDFLGWGWRYPFFVALAINVVALFARLRIVVTEEFQSLFNSRDLQASPAGETIAKEGRNILIGALAPLATFALVHMVTVFPLSWVFLFTVEAPTDFLLIEALAAAVGVVALLMSGVLADRFGRRNLLGVCAIGIAIFSGLAPMLLDGGKSGETIYMIAGFILLGLSFGQASGVVASSFTTQYRYTSSAFTSDLSWLFGAGFAPLLALLLTEKFGLAASGGYLLSGAVVTLIVLWLNKGFAKNR